MMRGGLARIASPWHVLRKNIRMGWAASAPGAIPCPSALLEGTGLSPAQLSRVISFCIHGKAEVIDRAGAVDACVGRAPCVLDGRVSPDIFGPIDSKQWNGPRRVVGVIYLYNDLQQHVQFYMP